MAYKFQRGAATLSGSLVQEGDLYVSSSHGSGDAKNLDVQGSIKVDGTQVISSARAVSNVTSIDGSGDLTMGTITMPGFAVDADGDVALKTLAVDNGSTIGCDADTDIMTLANQSLVLANDVDFNVAKAGGFQIGGTAVTSTAAELNLVDGITAGTVAASKAVIVDSNKDADGFRNISGSGLIEIDRITVNNAYGIAASGQFTGTKLVLGSANITEAELEMIDGITAGTVAASKAVVVDANKDASGFRNISASVHISASAFYGDGSKLSGLESEYVKTTTSNASATRYIPFVDEATGDDNESLLIHSAVSINPSTGVFTVAGSAPELVIGSAALNEADMEKLDGITNGTVAAAKAVVADSNKDVTGFRNVTATAAITAGTSFVIGSADLNETDMEKLDGITNGTVAANKAVVADGNKDFSGFRHVSGSGNGKFLSVYAADLTQGRIVTAGSSGQLEDQAALNYYDDRADGYLELSVSSSASGSAELGDGILTVHSNMDEVLIMVSKYTASTESGVMLADGAAPKAAIAAADSFLFFDATDNARGKKETIQDLADFMKGTVASTAISASSGVLSLDIANLNAETIASGDTFVFNDAGDNGLHKETVDDLFTIGPALVSEVALNLSQDYLLFLDGGASGDAKKDSLVDLVAAMAGAGLTQNASTGKLEVQSNAVALKADGDTLAEGYNYFADSSSNLGVDLPAAPDVGDVVTVKAGNLTSGAILRISKQGSHTIDGETAVDIESPYGALTFVYVVANNWRIV